MTDKTQIFPQKGRSSKAKGERVLKLSVPQQIQGFPCVSKKSLHMTARAVLLTRADC